jgi:hypothetical protein
VKVALELPHGCLGQRKVKMVSPGFAGDKKARSYTGLRIVPD